MRRRHKLLLINLANFILLSIIFSSCGQLPSKESSLIAGCPEPEGFKIIHAVSMSSCISCGGPLRIPETYIGFLKNHCSIIIADHPIPNYQKILEMHLTSAIVKNSIIYQNPEDYQYFKKKYASKSSSFILVFDYTHNLIFKSEINRSGIAQVDSLLRVLKLQ